jgi:hypothetical protein
MAGEMREINPRNYIYNNVMKVCARCHTQNHIQELQRYKVKKPWGLRCRAIQKENA